MKNHIFCLIKNYVGIVSNDNIYQMYQIIYDKQIILFIIISVLYVYLVFMFPILP
jgi:hypothetical protein